MRPRCLIAFGLAVLAATQFAFRLSAVTVAPEELATARRWVATRLDGRTPPPDTAPGLVVVANHDAVQKNARAGRPLKLVEREFTHGLFCHAASHLIVRLPSPGARFTATVGVDSNEQTSGGRGSVEFIVDVGGKNTFRSGVLREGMVALAFQDTVPGVPEAELPRLLERLYRVESSRSRSSGGAGLGLAICKNIVDAAGGSITVLPSPLGGVRIVVELPLTGGRS